MAAWHACGASDLPLADKGHGWDAGAAQDRIFAWAGWPDSPDPAKAKRAFFACDTAAAENKTAYKLPFADVIDSTLTAIPRALFAVAGALQGSRGGVDLPTAVQDTIRGRVGGYYATLKMTPPWDTDKAARGAGIEYKAVPTDFQASSTDEGRYRGYFSITGTRDDGGDLILPGAFTKTLLERGPKSRHNRIKIFYAHDPDKLIGPPPEVLQEDSTGLLAEGRLTLASFWGKEAWALMKDGALTEGSIGWWPIPGKTRYSAQGRDLAEVGLLEISPVPLGMHPDTAVSSVKSLYRAAKAFLSNPDPDAAEDEWQAVELLHMLVSYIQQTHLLQQADPDAMQIAAGMLQEAWAALSDLLAGTGTEAGMTTAGHPLLQALAAAVADCKEGRSISTSNATRLHAMHGHLTEALDHCTALLAAAEPGKSAHSLVGAPSNRIRRAALDTQLVAARLALIPQEIRL